MAPLKIAVAGAGIAGLTSALAFARAGHDVTIVERRTGFGESGAGIQVSPNASRILDGLGLSGALARTACEPEGVTIRSLRSGREIGAVRLGRFMRERYGAPSLAIGRSDLHTVLLDAVRGCANISIRIGRDVTGLADATDGITLTTVTSRGVEDVTAADLAVGADGLWSKVRALKGDSRKPVFSGYAAYRATVPTDAMPATLTPDRTGLWLGHRCHVVHYAFGGGRLVNIVIVARRREAGDGWSQPEDRERVLAMLTGASAPLMALLTAAESWVSWSLFDLPAREMGSGRVALIGDAAHPVLPYLAQGGSLAIEDAGHLAALIGPGDGDIAGAVRRFSRDRIARVRRVQAAARSNGGVYHAAAPIAVMRNLAMRRLGPTGMTQRYDWLYGWRIPPWPEAAT